jgi:hypothetical protein
MNVFDKIDFQARTPHLIQDIAMIPGCDACNSPQVLGAHFENNDDIRIGTPKGCSSSGSFTWTKFGADYSTSNNTDGSYSLYVGQITHYARIATTDVRAAGTVVMDVYIPVWSNWSIMWEWWISGTNRLNLQSAGVAGTISLEYKGNNVSKSLAQTGCSAAAAHTITLKWSVAAVAGHYLGIDVDGGGYAYYDTAITQMIGTWPVFELGGVLSAGNSLAMYVDNLRIYSAWT